MRVCLGYLTATRGRLIIETGALRVELAPEIDGTSRIDKQRARSEPIEGLTLTAIAGDAPFVEEHLTWAQEAIELAQQSGAPAFTGRPSPHWLDLDHFRVLLRAAVGNISVRQFLAELDGCTGSRAQSRDRRPVPSPRGRLSGRHRGRRTADRRPGRDQAAEAHGAAPAGPEGAWSPPAMRSPRARFTEGAHAPRAAIPFIVECWADGLLPDEQEDRLTGALYMNRTVALASYTGTVWHGQLDLTISGTAIRVPVPAGPHYNVVVNITSPMFRLTSDGKTPDCRPFREALAEAVGKAAKQAGRDIAAQMSAEQKQLATHRHQQQREAAQQRQLADREARQQRLALIETLKSERKALPTIRDVVLELLPDAIGIESVSRLMFNTRRLLYRIRDEVLQRSGRELKQGYFDDLLTEIEAEQGDLSPLLIREARGNFSIPHHGEAKPLGTLTVRAFLRPAWTFNKMIVIEKEDLRLMLEQAGWDERHDAFLMSAKGFNTRAARDLIDKIAETTEPVKVFSVHDGDSAGTLIQHTLQHATLARAARKIEVVDLGLQPWEGVALGLSVEKVPIRFTKGGEPIRRPVGEYVRALTDRAPKHETWEDWLQHSRIELNAFTSAQLIDWLDRKMAEHGAGKLIPPADILQDGFAERVRDRAHSAVVAAIDQRLDAQIAVIETERDEATKEIRAEIDRITADLHLQLAQVSEPFRDRIAAVQAEAQAIDCEAIVHRVIGQITPDADKLRTTIGEAFSVKPTLHWATVLHEIVEVTEVGNIDINDPGDDE